MAFHYRSALQAWKTPWRGFCMKSMYSHTWVSRQSFGWRLFVWQTCHWTICAPLHDSACLSVPLKWNCLVSRTVKGWRQELSRNAVLCVLFVKINHLVKDIWKEFILNSCKSKLLWVWTSDAMRPHRKSDSGHFPTKGNEIRGILTVAWTNAFHLKFPWWQDKDVFMKGFSNR